MFIFWQTESLDKPNIETKRFLLNNSNKNIKMWNNLTFFWVINPNQISSFEMFFVVWRGPAILPKCCFVWRVKVFPKAEKAWENYKKSRKNFLGFIPTYHTIKLSVHTKVQNISPISVGFFLRDAWGESIYETQFKNFSQFSIPTLLKRELATIP